MFPGSRSILLPLDVHTCVSPIRDAMASKYRGKEDGEFIDQAAGIMILPLHEQLHGDNNSVALQELRNLQTHLYIAASHYESAYLCSEEKLLVLENLKDFTAKMFADSLDCMNTVVTGLNELLTQHAAELLNIEIRMSCLAQRVSSCHEWMICHGLDKWRYKRWKLSCIPRNDPAGKTPTVYDRISQEGRRSDLNKLPMLSWYLSTDLSSIISSSLEKKQDRISSSNRCHCKETFQRAYFQSQSCRKFPSYIQEIGSSLKPRIQGNSVNLEFHAVDLSIVRSKSLLSLMIAEDMEQQMSPSFGQK